MTTITINRGESVQVPFSITDSLNGLAGKRVTWALGQRPGGPQTPLRKASGLGVSSADIVLTTVSAGQLAGVIKIAATDFAYLPEAEYWASLWIDDGTTQTCVTAGGYDVVQITPTIARA